MKIDNEQVLRFSMVFMTKIDDYQTFLVGDFFGVNTSWADDS